MAKKKSVHPRKSRQVVSDTAIAVALGKTGGVLNSAARALKITRQALTQRIQNSEDLAAAHQEAIDVNLDLVEAKLIAAAKKGAAWAVRLYLTNIGRGRGYGQKLEISGSLNTGVVTEYLLPANGRDDSTDDTDENEDNVQA